MFGPPQYCEGHEKERETNLSVPNNFTCVHMYIMYNNFTCVHMWQPSFKFSEDRYQNKAP